MARYAITRDADGLVTNCAEWDGVSSWSPPPGHTARLDSGGIARPGGTWNGSTFLPPPPPPPIPTATEKLAGIGLTRTELQGLTRDETKLNAALTSINGATTVAQLRAGVAALVDALKS